MEILSCVWLLNSVDVNAVLDNIIININKIADRIAPQHIFEIKSNQIPFYDNELRIKARQRDIAYKSFKSSCVMEKQQKWQVYKNERNQYVDMLKQKKKCIMNNKLILINTIVKKCGKI